MPEPQPRSGQFIPGSTKVEYPTPLPNDKLLTEFLATNAADYLALLSGSAHLDYPRYPGYRLVDQVPINWQEVARIYAKDREPAEDTYNYSISFDGESASHPTYTRDYLVRRSQYVAGTPARASTLTGVVLIKVTGGGTGYTQEKTIVTPSGGGGGSGLTATAIVSDGVVIGVVITDEGQGYTAAPTLVISTTDSSHTVAATATAFIQSASAVLVKEDLLRTPDAPTDSLYVVVRRVYMTLPGPWVPFTRYDDLLGPIQGRRRAVLNTGQVASLTATVKTTYEGRDGSAIVSLEIEETSGAGVAGFSAYPIGTEDLYDDERGPVQRVTQLVTATGSEVGSLVMVGAVATRTEYVPYNQFLLRKIIETWTLPGPEFISPGFDNATGAQIRIVRQHVVDTTANEAVGTTRAFSAVTFYCVDSVARQINDVESVKTTEYWTLPANKTEHISVGYQFPAMFDFIVGWTYDSDFRNQPPFAGVNFTLSAHRTASKPVVRVTSYSFGASGAVPDTYQVTTPGAADRFFGIGQKTIHNAIELIETNGAGSITVEDLPASTPSTYTPGDDLIIQAEEVLWKRPFYRLTIDTASE